MDQYIESIQLISINVRYGPPPPMTKEVEQRLTISSSGRVCFSARTYGQQLAHNGFCRKKQLDIGPWKAQYLLTLADRIQMTPMATDCGIFDLTVRYNDGSTKMLSGSLVGDVTVNISGEVSLTKLFRRYIPVYGLWAFDSCLSPDYEGKKEIFEFSKKWLKKFRSDEPIDCEFENSFGRECAALGFQMDGGHEFNRLYPDCFDYKNQKINTIIAAITDVDLLGAALYSQWRYCTHWGNSSVSEARTWYIIMLTQMAQLTKKREGSVPGAIKNY